MAREFNNLSDYEDIKDYISAWFTSKALQTFIKWKVIGDNKLMSLLDVKINPDYIKEIYGDDLTIIVNPILFEDIPDDETLMILINEQMDCIAYDANKGKVSKVKKDYTTSSYYQEKVGAENLIQAKTIEKEKIASLKQTLKENKR